MVFKSSSILTVSVVDGVAILNASVNTIVSMFLMEVIDNELFVTI